MGASLPCKFAKDLGVGLELRREGCAQLGQGGGWVGDVGVGGFVVDDPPGFVAGGEGLEAGAEEAVDLDGAERAGDDAGPAGFAGFFGVGRENPVAGGVVGGGEGEAGVLRRRGRRLGGVDAGGADLRGDAGLELLEGGAGLSQSLVLRRLARGSRGVSGRRCPGRGRAGRLRGAGRERSRIDANDGLLRRLDAGGVLRLAAER